MINFHISSVLRAHAYLAALILVFEQFDPNQYQKSRWQLPKHWHNDQKYWDAAIEVITVQEILGQHNFKEKACVDYKRVENCCQETLQHKIPVSTDRS